ncbi:MAG: rRNA pseudouridine synthase [Culturomica sp.]|jgi:23S rRNA pseudouridine2605 synthase|nr:rRNA pseudouridine synthase [Culturomica sp.]
METKKKYTRNGGVKTNTNRTARLKKGDNTTEKRPFKRRFDDKEETATSRKPALKRRFDDREGTATSRKPTFKRRFDDREETATSRKPAFKRKFNEREETAISRKPTFKRRFDEREGTATSRKPALKRKFDEREETATSRKPTSKYNSTISEEEKDKLRSSHYSKKKLLAHNIKNLKTATELRLNHYISIGGICSRRDADILIKEGRIKVNGKIVTEVGVKVNRDDKVHVDGTLIAPEKKVYLVLNKPKDYVTTLDDPMERKTVMSLIEGACKERVYPVGRLDRNTTGVLLFTNDGELAKKLTHPSYGHKKIYHVFLEQPLLPKDLAAIKEGVELEDGFTKADDINYVTTDKKEVGIEIHSGKNRIVRRIFEHFGYNISRLDRVYFAGITKKNIARGKWRFLSKEEVDILKIY